MVEKGRGGTEGCVKVSEVHQGGLGKKMMVGFVQETRGKFMRKVHKLGQICEGLCMTCEHVEEEMVTADLLIYCEQRCTIRELQIKTLNLSMKRTSCTKKTKLYLKLT